MLQLDLRENNWQLVDQILLFIVLSEDRRHLLLQIADDVGMDLGLRKKIHSEGFSHQAFNTFNANRAR